MTKNVLFALTSHDTLGDTGRKTGAYAPEFAHPAQVFESHGYDIDLVSVRGGTVPLDGLKDDDTVTQQFIKRGDIKSKLAATLRPDQVNADHYGLIFFTGGHGTMWDFPDDAPLAKLAADIYEAGGVVAGVCHGPAGLVNVKLSDGSYLVDSKEVSSFTNDEEQAVGLAEVVPFLLEDALVQRGAQHTKADNFAEYAVSDGRLVTGQNPASAKKVALLAIEAHQLVAHTTHEGERVHG